MFFYYGDSTQGLVPWSIGELVFLREYSHTGGLTYGLAKQTSRDYRRSNLICLLNTVGLSHFRQRQNHEHRENIGHMDQIIAFAILLIWILFPALHVAFSANGGAWSPPEGSGCPFGPRVGWLVIVILLGLIGWMMFMRSHRNRTPP